MSQTTNASSVATYVPPHMNANRSSTALETRYSRSQLLDLYRDQKDAGELGRGLDALFVGDWVDGQHDGDTSTKWSRRDELKHSSQPASDVCWDRSGAIEPLGLVDMTEEEKEVSLQRSIFFFGEGSPGHCIDLLDICQFSSQRPTTVWAPRWERSGRSRWSKELRFTQFQLCDVRFELACSRETPEPPTRAK